MRFSVIAMLGLMVCLSGAAVAQTLYNSPGQSGGSSTHAPLNLRALMGNRANTAQTGSPAPGRGRQAEDAAFQRKKSALDQWRAERDRQAVVDQRNARLHMAAVAGSTASPPSQQQQLQQQPGAPGRRVPMIYRGKDDKGIQKPRPLFNSVR